MPPNSNEWPQVKVSEWLQQIVEEQDSSIRLEPSRPTEPFPTSSKWIKSFFDGIHYANLCQTPITTHLKEDKKGSRANKGQPPKRYFEDPIHELALFMITDGRSMPQTAICALGCFNLPRMARTSERYLLKAQIHPQFPDVTDYNNWLTTLVDQLAVLSQVGFKARDLKGTRRTYKAHLVCITDDLVDRNRMLSNECPQILRQSGCLSCGIVPHKTKKELDEHQQHLNNGGHWMIGVKDSIKENDAKKGGSVNADSTLAETANVTNSDTEDSHSKSDSGSAAKSFCDCQIGFFEPLPGDQELPPPVSRWRPYARDIFNKLGSLSVTDSFPPDLAHIYNHVMLDLLKAALSLCKYGDERRPPYSVKQLKKFIRMWNSQVPIWKSPVAFTRRLRVMESFPGLYYNLRADKVCDPEVLQCIAAFVFYLSQLNTSHFVADQIVSLQSRLCECKWALYTLLKNKGEMDLCHRLFGYPMHLLDHVGRWIMMVGPLIDIWGEHTSQLAQRATYLVLRDSKYNESFKEQLEGEINRMMQLRAVENNRYGGYCAKMFKFKTTTPEQKQRLTRFSESVLDYIHDYLEGTNVVLTWYHGILHVTENNLPIGADQTLPILSWMTDGKVHLVTMMPPADHTIDTRMESGKFQVLLEYAILIGFFKAEYTDDMGKHRVLHRALVRRQIDPTDYSGFAPIRVTIPGQKKSICIGDMFNMDGVFSKRMTIVNATKIRHEPSIKELTNPDLWALCRLSGFELTPLREKNEQ